MTFRRPTLPELVTEAEADLDARLPGSDARLPASNLNVLARVHRGGVHGLYGFLSYLADQLFPESAEAEHLERRAGTWGIARRPAASAGGLVGIGGTDGAVIPAGTVLQRSDGVEYATSAEAVIAAGAASVRVSATLAGAAGNSGAGVKLRLVSALAGVRSEATVAADGLSAGADAEADDSLLARLLDRIQAPPHGGAKGDYVRWARQVPGVTRVWVYPRELGPGTVTVRFVMDDKPDTIIPTADEVAAVQARIEGDDSDDVDARPVTAEVFVVAPIPQPLDLTIAGLVPGNAATRAAVEASYRELILREAVPGGTILRSHLTEAISAAAGEHDHQLVAPVADVAHGTGIIAVPGTIDWI